MSMDRKLLDILCCPVSKRPVQPLPDKELERLNQLIQEGRVRYMDDSEVEAPLEQALITDNGSRIYRVDDGIPVMLEERGLPGSALEQPPPRA